MTSIHQKRRVAFRRVVIIAAVTVLIAMLAVLYFPVSILNREITTRLSDFLVEKLGPEAVIGDVKIGWREATVEQVVLPLDSAGSRLEIQKIDFDLDLLSAISQPSRVERVLRSVSVDEPRLYIVQKRHAGSSEDTLQNSLKIPSATYDILSRLDSLRQVNFYKGSVWIESPDTTISIVHDMVGHFEVREPETLELRAAGRYLDSFRNRLSVRGEIQPRDHVMRFDVNVTIPKGNFPVAVHDSVLIETSGGEATASILIHDSLTQVRGSYSVSEIEAVVWSHPVSSSLLSGSFHDKIIELNTTHFNTDWYNGSLSGIIYANGNLDLLGSIRSDSLQKGAKSFSFLNQISGDFESVIEIGGSIKSPHVVIRAESSQLSYNAIRVSDVNTRALLNGDGVEIQELTLRVAQGRMVASGFIPLKKEADLTLAGQLEFDEIPSLFGLKTAIASVDFLMEGSLNNPETTLYLKDSTEAIRGHADFVLQGTSWSASIKREAAGIAEGNITAQILDDSLNVHAEEVQVIAAILFPQADSAVALIDQFSLSAAGSDSAGSIHAELRIKQDSTHAFSQVTQQLSFDGNYFYSSDSISYIFGDWSGVSGTGDSFFGQGELVIDDRIIELRNFYIDEIGTVAARINLDSQDIQLNISIDQLPFSRFPIRPDFFEKTRLDGSLSGDLHVTGSLKSPVWMCSLTLIDGTMFSVPGYWVNLDMSGEKTRVDSLDLSFGRDISKILDAKGTLDFGANTVDITAGSGEAVAEDFFLALTGVHGLLTGSLNSTIEVTGKLSDPDITAALQVVNGEVLSEIAADEFTAMIELTHDKDGHRVLRIPSLVFGKAETYRFFGELTTELRTGGKLTGYFEGSGDFLDILDQIDATFYGYGSNGMLRMDFGGTFDKPEFLGGQLALQNGRFGYASATPVPVDMTIDITVAAGGISEGSNIAFRSGNDYLIIRSVQTNSYPDLKPIVLTKPQLNIGILEIETSDDGMVMRIPGFMKPEWVGTFVSGESAKKRVALSSFDEKTIYITGDLTIRNSRFTFPFVGSGSGKVFPVTEWMLARLMEATWNLDVHVGTGNHYDVEITGIKDSDLMANIGGNSWIGAIADYFDHVSVDAIIDPTDSPLEVNETIADTSFHLLGRLSSYNGRVDYLDQSFRIDYLLADFDETSIMPVVEGRAVTYGVDSLGRSVPVYLTIYEIDPETGTYSKQGRFDKVTYVLETDETRNPEEVLALLGYGVGNTGTKAEEVLARTAFGAAKRAWLDPIAREIEKFTIFDEVALAPGGKSESIFRQQREQAMQDTLAKPGVVRYFTGSHVTVGKYLTENLFLTYTGELTENAADLTGSRLGLVHLWNMEYRMKPVSRNLVLDFAVEFDEIERRRDESVALKYSFTLEP